MNNQIILECKKVKFYAPHDEDAFFEWIKKIECITNVKGKRDVICLFIANKKITLQDLGSIMALFRRYRIATKQLEIFITNKNREFFEHCKTSSHFNMYPYRPEDDN